MEQLLSGLATDRETPGTVGARLESALHIRADAQIFVLHTVADGNALRVVLATRLAHVTEIEIEDDPAVVDVERQNEIRVHVAFVAIDHEVWILPEIPSAIAFASVAGGGVLVRCHHRAGLQAIPVFNFDGVLLVVEHTAQRLVQVWNVIAPVEVVVDENLPIARDVVNLAIKKMKLTESQRLASFPQPTQEIFERFRLRIKIHQDKGLPSLDFDRDQAIFPALEIFHAIKLWHPFQRPVEAVVPSVVRTMQEGGTATC